MLNRRGILGLLSAVAATAGLSLLAAPSSFASAPLGPHPVCAQANPARDGISIQLDAEWHQPGNGPCVRVTGSKDNSAVWA